MIVFFARSRTPKGAKLVLGASAVHVRSRLLPSTARSMMAGRVFLVLTGACQFGYGLGGFTTSFVHSRALTTMFSPFWRRHPKKREKGDFV